jgi:hypothetical protein
MEPSDAINAIGTQAPEDWHLRPETHEKALPKSAGPLKRILLRDDLEQIIEIYNEADTRAQKAQGRYKGPARFAGFTSFAAIVIASSLLLPAVNGIPKLAINGVVALQGMLIVASFSCSLLLIYTKPFAEWMRARAQAEHARIKLFNRVFEETEEKPEPGELPLLPLQLEYFRRYQLDVQRLYYEKRGAQHARAVKIGGFLRMAALLLIACAVFPIIWQLQGRDWVPQILRQVFVHLPADTELSQRVFLCLGLIGSGLQGLLATLSLMSQDERNATRYRDTSRNLDDLAERPLQEARRAGAEGDRDRVLGFVALVNEQISSEHREWVALRAIVPDLSLDTLRNVSLPKLS